MLNRKFLFRKGIPAVLLCMACFLAGEEAFAYQTSYDFAGNTMLIGYNETTITEEFPPSDPKPPTDNPSFPKKVAVTAPNTEANVDSYVRMRVSCSNSDLGDCLVLEGLNTTDWVRGEDGYYYYRNRLRAGESTSPLFTAVTLSSEKLTEKSLLYAKELRVFVYEESVEAHGFTSYQEAWAASPAVSPGRR